MNSLRKYRKYIWKIKKNQKLVSRNAFILEFGKRNEYKFGISKQNNQVKKKMCTQFKESAKFVITQ